MRKRQMAQVIVKLLEKDDSDLGEPYVPAGARRSFFGYQRVSNLITPSKLRERVFLLLHILHNISEHKVEITSIISVLKACDSPAALQKAVQAQLKVDIKATCLMRASVFETWNTGVAAQTLLLVQKKMPKFFCCLDQGQLDAVFTAPARGSFMSQVLAEESLVTRGAVEQALPDWFDPDLCLSLQFDGAGGSRASSPDMDDI